MFPFCTTDDFLQASYVIMVSHVRSVVFKSASLAIYPKEVKQALSFATPKNVKYEEDSSPNSTFCYTSPHIPNVVVMVLIFVQSYTSNISDILIPISNPESLAKKVDDNTTIILI
jgi:hypothetical protein